MTSSPSTSRWYATIAALTLFGCGGRVTEAAGGCDDPAGCGGATNGSTDAARVAPATGGCDDPAGCGGATSTSVGGCSDLEPCGGVLEGTWQVDSNCLDADLVSALNSKFLADGGPPACRDWYQSYEVVLTGTVTYKAGMATTNGMDWMTVRVMVTAECDRQLTNSSATALTAARCKALEQELFVQVGHYDSASCELVGDVCLCDSNGSYRENPGPDPYEISGDTVFYSNTPASARYCVTGDVMTQWASAFRELKLPGVITFHRL